MAIMVCIMALAGCAAEAPAAPPQQPASTPGDYSDIGEMRILLEASGFSGDWWEGAILYARTAGRLTFPDGSRLELTTFANDQAQQDYVAAVAQFGGVVIQGDLWAVVAETMSDAEKAQRALGGSIS
jgi:hypothetical protein